MKRLTSENIKNIYPMSPMQQGMYFHYLLDKSSSVYFEQLSYRLHGELQVNLVEKSLNELLKRYDILRTGFNHEKKDILLQVVLKEQSIDFFYKDISNMSTKKKKEEFIKKYKERDRQNPFDLGKDVLIRSAFIQLRKNEYEIIWSFHHILMDGWCVGILISEFLEIYRSYIENREYQLPPVKQYSSYIKWLESRDQEASKIYWKRYLAGYEETTGITKIKEYNWGKNKYQQEQVLLTLDREETDGLNKIARKSQVTLNCLIQSYWGVILGKYNNKEDVVFGAVVSGRPSEIEEIERMVGLFINTIPVRIRFDSETYFNELIQLVQDNALKSEKHHYYPLAEIQSGSYLKQNLIDHILIFENYPMAQRIEGMVNTNDRTTTELPLTISNTEVFEQTNYYFNLVIIPGDRLGLAFQYNSNTYNNRQVERIANTFNHLVNQVINNDHLKIKELEIISEKEKKQLLYDFNDTKVRYPAGKTLHELFAGQAGRTPDYTALVGKEEGWKGRRGEGWREVPSGQINAFAEMHFSYKELNEKSNQLALQLLQKGVMSDTIVGLIVERSITMIIGILGILKSGAAYLPIDPDYPEERINFMMADSTAKTLLTSDTINRVPTPHLSFYPSTLPPFYPSNPSNLAYIIYTSGTTGKPKGVLVEHKNVVRLLFNDKFQFDFNEKDVWTMFHSYCFDFSVWEMYGALLYGGKLVLFPRMAAKDPEFYYLILKTNQVNVLNQTPSAFYNLMAEALNDRGGEWVPRYVIFGGEALNPLRLKEWQAKYPQTKLINMFGITETTVHVTYKEITSREIQSNTSNIGKAIPTLGAYVMDSSLKLVAPGVAGELLVGGEGIARGYLNRPGLTAEKFVTNPYKPGERCYRSGDLVRLMPGGDMEYLGRIDQQIQVRGFRIELGEIENRLLSHQEIKEAVVISRINENGNHDLCAYIVLNTGETGILELNIAEIREYLSRMLPDYMIPSYFTVMEQIPLTANGKLDRAALPEPGTGLTGDSYVPPTGWVEEKLVQVWQEVLGVEGIGITDNFFEIGGDSIKAIQVSARLKKHNLEVKIIDLFSYPNIKELAGRVKKTERIISQEAVTGQVRLTPIQQWFFHKDYNAGFHFNQAVLLYSREGFVREAIEAVFKKLQHHHDALRMTFQEENGRFLQVNQAPDHPFSLQEYDLRHCENALKRLEDKANEIQSTIDLATGPLMKLGLFHLEDGDRLLIVIHHLVIDGVSWRILFEDIETLYRQYQGGRKLELPLKSDSFKTWAEELSKYADSELFLKEKAYWTRLESMKCPGIKEDVEIKGNYIKDTASLSFLLSEENTKNLLTKVNEPFATEINDILLTALGLGIKKTFGHERISIALEGHGREEILKDIDISRTVGWFTTIYPVVLDISYGHNLARQIKEVKERLHHVPNKGIGWGILKYLTSPENKNEIQFNLKPRVSFNYLGQFDADVEQKSFTLAEESPGNSVSPNTTRAYDFDFSGMILDKQLRMSVTYNKKQYKPETLERLLNHFKTALIDIIDYCSQRKERELTPCDFTYNEMTIDDLEGIYSVYDNKRKGNIQDIYPLSPMQEGMLFHSLADPSSLAYFEQISYRLQGEFDISYLEISINELLKRHDILRTAFDSHLVDRPIQIVLKERKVDFYYEDLRSRHPLADEQEKNLLIENFKEKDKQRSFNPSKDVLIRVSVLQLDTLEYEFTWSFHHLLMDGWCIGILNNEFFEIYNGYLEIRPYRLPGVKAYRTYIQWLERQDKKESAQYWANYLDSFEEQTGVPRTRISKEGSRYRNETVAVELDKERTTGLKKLAGRSHVTLNTVTQAVWGILLGKYNGKEDVVFGAVVSGRPSELEGVETMVGLFINTIPVRIRFEEKTKFHQLLERVQENAIDREPHHYHPLVEIQNNSALKQNLLDHLFIFENYPIAQQIEGYGREKKTANNISLRLTNVELFEQTNYDFNILITGSEEIRITFQYNGNVYARDFVERIAKHFCFAVDQVIDNQELEFGQLTLLTEEEKNRLLYQFNDTEADYPKDKTIHRWFAEQVEQTPDHIAVTGQSLGAKHLQSLPDTNVPALPGLQLSYRELNESSNQLGYQLREKGVGPDSIVGLMLKRSAEMIIGMLGIIKAGGAYLPIDSEYPRERKRYMLKNGEVRWLLVNDDIEGIDDEIVHRLELIDMRQEESYKRRNVTLEYRGSGSNLVYVIYTSGSTGKPKGVMVEHRNLVNLFKFQFNYTNIDCSRILQFATISFDASFHEIFSAFLSGGQLYLVNEETRTDIPGLFKLIQRNEIKTVFLPISFLKMIFNEEEYLNLIPRCISHIQTAGEQVVLSNNFRKYLRERKVYLHNHYGPSETHVVTTLTIDPEGEISELPSIGKPVVNTRIYIVDKWGRLSPLGVVGEIWIGGVQVGRGYYGQEKLTEEKFLSNPFRDGDRIYRSGDLGRWLLDGNIEFLGRIDSQVKIRGFRVEPGEIESHLLKHKEIKEAVVVSREDKEGSQQYLCGYFVSDRNIPGSEIRGYLSTTLPDYMIPSYYVQVEQIPLTPNGKIDRKALPAPGMTVGEDYVAPRNKVERKLVEIWAEVLKIEKAKIGINSDFFDLGGHSLKATILMSRINKELKTKITLADIFKHKTTGNLAEYIKTASEGDYPSIESVEKREYYALSAAQKRLFILNMGSNPNLVYNLPMVLLLESKIDKRPLEKSLQELIQRHESLRTSFHIIEGNAVQIIHDEVDFHIDYRVLKAENEQSRDEINTIVEQFIKPFKLDSAPLLRVKLVKLPGDRHLLLLDMHHIITDGVSEGIFVKEFQNLYRGAELPALPIQYKDFSGWQNSEKGKTLQVKQERYWLDQFKEGVPLLSLPTDFPRPRVRSFQGDYHRLTLEPSLSLKLKEITRETETTLNMFLMAVYYILLWKYSGHSDIVVGVTIAARTHPDIEDIMGFFVNTLPVRTRLDKVETFGELLAEVKKITLEAYENQDYPFNDLVGKLNISGAQGRNPLFDVAFVVQNMEIGTVEIERVKMSPYPFQTFTSRFDMLMFVREASDSIEFSLEYSSELFKPTTIGKFMERYHHILNQVLGNRNIKLNDITISYERTAAEFSALSTDTDDFEF